MGRRTVTLHTRSIAIDAQSDRDGAICDHVCASLRCDTADDPSFESIAVSQHADETIAAEELMGELTTKLIWDYKDGLAMHAAAIEVGGRTLLFPASSGGGKTTLSVVLAASGGRFLTDELVFIPLGEMTVHPLTRPAHLKRGSVFVLEQFPALNARRYANGALVSFPAAAPATIGAIVLPSYAADAEKSIERLEPGFASYTLLSALVNSRNLPGLGVSEVARICALVPVYRIRYRNCDEALELLNGM